MRPAEVFALISEAFAMVTARGYERTLDKGSKPDDHQPSKTIFDCKQRGSRFWSGSLIENKPVLVTYISADAL